MTRILIFLTFFISFFHSYNAFAWSATGHGIVVEIAFKNLSPLTKARVSYFLQGRTLELASTWMDSVKSIPAYSYLTPTHYIDLNKGVAYNPQGSNDVVYELKRTINALSQLNTLSDSMITQYVLEICHLVGDIHQPLHCGYGVDVGGNNTRVNFMGTRDDLHHVWDYDIINYSNVSLTSCLATNTFSPADIQAIQQIDVLQWMQDSRQFVDTCYSPTTNNNLDSNYVQTRLPIVNQQLIKGGLRLAAVLEMLFGANISPQITSVTPNSGNQGSIITITGKYLGQTSSIYFGSVAAQKFLVINDSTVIATLGNGQSGSILLNTPGGSVFFQNFTYVPTSSNGTVIVSDSLALVDLYNNTNGNGWANNQNWLSPAPINTWYGVFVQNNRVVSLGLSNNLLMGSIPVSFGNLTAMQYALLDQNLLSGSLPTSLTNLQQLNSFTLQLNMLNYTSWEPIIPLITPKYSYVPQNPLVHILSNQTATLMASGQGGNAANNRYIWYNLDSSTFYPQAVIYGDSNYLAKTPGHYLVVVNNSIVNKLTFYSDTFLVNNITLPINLLAINVQSSNGKNSLFWETSLTGSIMTFVVEESNDGVHFNPVGKVESNLKTSASPYKFIDIQPVSPVYYRLKMVSIDGSSGYSAVLTTNFEDLKKNNIVVSPNPAKSVLNVRFNKVDNKPVLIQLYGLDGNIYKEQQYKLSQGNVSVNVDLGGLINGIYILKVEGIGEKRVFVN